MVVTAWQETPYTIPLIVAAAITTISAVYIWQRHRVAAAKTAALALLAGAGWVVGYALEQAAADLHTKILWYRVELLSVIIMSITWLVFTLQYTGHEKWVNRRSVVFLSSIPAITLILVFTNEYHGLMWSRVVLTTEGLFVVSEFVHGMWFWIHTTYSYILVLSGFLLLFQMLIRSQRLYRWQIIALLLAAFFPMLLTLLNLVGLYSLAHLPVAILLFPVVSAAVAWSIFRFRPQDIVPVARGAVIDGMSDGVMVLDLENRIVDVNPSAQQVMGYPPSELIGQYMGKVWPEWSQIELNDGVQSDKEIAVNLKDGQRIYDVRISPLTDWYGNLISQIVVLRDVTERKKAEKLLYESEEKFRTIFEHANDEIIYVDKYGVIVDMNKRFEKIFGYKREEAIGKNFAEFGFFDKEDMARVVSLFRDAITKGETIPFILLELKRKDGGSIFAEVSTRMIKKNGEIEGILSILRDVTERKKAEENVKASLREKEVLLREIHHRVKNNLQIISSLLSLQSRYIRESQYTEMFKESQNRVRSMALIHEKLYQSEDLAKIDFTEYIKPLVHELIRSYEVDPDKVAVRIQVDDVSLGVDTAIPCGLIINELVSNSLKHAFPDRKGEIKIALHSVDGTIELTVSDNGVGIPDTIDFRNAETLGLRLVTILAEDQLDGDINLIRGKGTQVRITFRG
ncbi:MAG: PAS domain S-box protein [Theionarchaea archaeon]|nr:PAS domain S-box protein [Theionarchaea archaeon]